MINSSVISKIHKISQLNRIDINHNYRWCTHWLRSYKHLCEEVSLFLTHLGMTDQAIFDLREENNEIMSLIQSNLGYTIMPEHFYNNWITKGSDFSYGDITTALRNFERLNNDYESVILKSITLFESNITKISKHNNERTAFVRSAMSNIYKKEA
jgi:hypothetical protein